MSIPSIHSSLRSQAAQQNAPAAQFERGQAQFRPAVRVDISTTSGMAEAAISASVSDVLVSTTSAGRLASAPGEANITMRRGVEAYAAWGA